MVRRVRGSIRSRKEYHWKYKNITLIVLDDKGEIRYMGPILYDDQPEGTTRVTD